MAFYSSILTPLLANEIIAFLKGSLKNLINDVEVLYLEKWFFSIMFLNIFYDVMKMRVRFMHHYAVSVVTESIWHWSLQIRLENEQIEIDFGQKGSGWETGVSGVSGSMTS